jgi:lysophospholipase L1-like esterase
MRIVLLGDSHLARVRRDLPALGRDVCNAAEGGASSLDLLAQATGAAVEEDDLVVVSVGTNDAAPWKHVPMTVFAHTLSQCLQSVPARRWVYVAPPGVDESRLSGPGDRTNAVLDAYRDAAVSACDEAGARVVRTERLIGPLGADAFVSDGLHLSGRAYRVVLPAIAEAAHGGHLGAQRSIQ